MTLGLAEPKLQQGAVTQVERRAIRCLSRRKCCLKPGPWDELAPLYVW
jgi:hypothetical protein